MKNEKWMGKSGRGKSPLLDLYPLWCPHRVKTSFSVAIRGKSPLDSVIICILAEKGILYE